ncbi:MAG TPA: FlgD immunoglobulin-like domain containing protein [Candidatus Krumholzibacteria bacterium]|nr:FlgD immunoglobulin-like domain containing protein [Candidatus Krumholzibacteria bacterium]HPD73069.1 FlgD immunoglobulin-like domain containing protein [Candidatus Krumholzibacteria bacterium]HRY41869.1 FlgD immunoglobulin-like domain containing protein [Candidatus Krumholzibacteria bacterium]
MPARMRIVALSLATLWLAAASPAGAHLSVIRQGVESQDLAQPDDALGRAVAGGDFNGDGFADVVSAAPDEANGLVPAAVQGLVVVNYGSPTGPVPDLATLVTVGDVPDQVVRFGRALAVGNFNGDAYDDLAVGAPELDHLAVTDAGAVFVFHGGPLGLSSTPATLLDQSAVNAAVEAEDLFGWSLAAGDFDQDGYDDLGIGSIGENDDAGAVSWIAGSAGGLVPGSGDTWSQTELGAPSAANDWFGYALAVGDFDGSGYPDLAAGAPRKEISSPTLIDAGVVYILFSLTNGLSDFAAAYDAASLAMDPQGNADFGWALAAGVFFAADGADDLAIGEPRADGLSTTDSGRAICLDFDPGPRAPAPATDIIPWPPADKQWISQGVNGTADSRQAFDRFGFALGAGDFDGDGLDDVGVGVPGEDIFLNDAEGTPLDCGMAHVFYGAPGGPSWQRVDTFSALTQMDYATQADIFGQAVGFSRCDDTGRASFLVGAPGKDYVAYSGGTTVFEAGAVFVIAPWRQPQLGSARRASVALDCDGGIIYSQHPFDRLRPASTTKTLTLLLSCEALAANVVDLDDVYTVPDWVATKVGGSQMNLYTGEEITFGDLMKGMMTVSGNDAAYALADLIMGDGNPWGGDYASTLPGFQAIMNQRASQLGMIYTTMTNPPGLDVAGHYTTALDFALLARAAMENECVREIVGTSPWILDRQAPPWQQGFLALNTVQTVFYNGYVDGIQGLVPAANGVKGGSTPGAQKTGLFSAAGLGGDTIASLMGAYKEDMPVEGAPGGLLFTGGQGLLELGLESCDPDIVLPPPGGEPDGPFGTVTGIPTQQGGGRSLLVPVEDCAEPVVVELVRQTHGLPSVQVRVAAQRTTSVLLPPGEEVQLEVPPLNAGSGPLIVLNDGDGRALLRVTRSDNSSLVFNLALQPFESTTLPQPPANPSTLFWSLLNTGTIEASLVLEEPQMFEEATLGGAPWTKSFGCPAAGSTRSQMMQVTVAGWDPVAGDLVALIVRESGTVVAVPEGAGTAPARPAGAVARLHPATPNPFNPVTHLSFDLARSARVDLAIYDVRGHLVRTVVARELPAGAHDAVWDGRGGDGRLQAAGVYVARLNAGGEVQTQRLVLLK